MATKSKTATATPRRALTRAQTSTSPAPDPAALVESAPLAQQQALQALIAEQKQTNTLLRRLLYGGIGFVVGIAVMILLQRIANKFLFF